MIALPMPVCGRRAGSWRLQDRRYLLLASRYQGFRLIALSFQIALGSPEVRRFALTLTSGRVTH